ncbi:MAG: hypothetical protein H0W40_17195 [Methylibium sp.]|uniref:hypothetical protein n=1 Tax=Methylibium sp. TaxID=2067992 RepID=UPI0017E6DE7E|nr:hypothetical protein [Methylibium sp.]MBA3599089.1 hypothetical protein [Methylibium sp.]
MREIGLILFGWLLGLLGPALVEAIKQRRQVDRVFTALAQELHQLRYRLTLACQGVLAGLGKVDDGHLRWLQKQLAGYRGPHDKTTLTTYVEKLLALTTEERRRFLETQRSQPHRTVRVQRYAVPLLDSRLASLWTLDDRVQVRLLELRTNLDMLDREVDEATYFFRLTYDDREHERMIIVNSSLDEASERWVDRAKQIADKLEELEPLLQRGRWFGFGPRRSASSTVTRAG